MARVEFHPQFESDVRAQVEFLRSRGDVERIHGLLDDLNALRKLVADFPEAGRELKRSGDESLRMMWLRRASFLAWYRSSPGARVVTMYRLFHVRQRRPEPRLP